MNTSYTGQSETADQIEALVDRRTQQILGLKDAQSMSPERKKKQAEEPYSLDLARQSVMGTAREARAESRAEHEQLLRRLDLPHNTKDMAQWIRKIENSTGHNQYPGMIRWTKYFFGPDYMGDATNNYTTDYTAALDVIKTHEFLTAQLTSNPSYATAANKELLAQMTSKEPDAVVQARVLVAERDARANELIAEARGEIARAQPFIEDARKSYADVLTEIRDRVVDSQQVFTFAKDNLTDLTARPTHRPEASSRWGVSLGASKNQPAPGTTTISDVLRQLGLAFRTPKDPNHMKGVFEDAERQLGVDKTLKGINDSRDVKTITSLGTPNNKVAESLPDGRAAATSAAGMVRGGGSDPQT